MGLRGGSGRGVLHVGGGVMNNLICTHLKLHYESIQKGLGGREIVDVMMRKQWKKLGMPIQSLYTVKGGAA